MTESLHHLATAFAITAPLVLVAGVGMLVRASGLIDQSFVHSASKLVFNVSLPCLLFTLVFNADWRDRDSLQLVLFSLANTVLLVLLAIAAARFLVSQKRDRGVFVQGVFRSNMGVVSLALVDSAYGLPGLEMAAVPITLNTLLYNVTAVFLLSGSEHQSGRQARRQAMLGVLKNPLILAIALGMAAAALQLTLPASVERGASLLSQLALPLALLCVGASLKLHTLVPPDPVASWAAVGKLLVAPLLALTLAYGVFGIGGMPLGILLFMTGSPAATAGFAMVVGFGGNAALSAQIIALTTVVGVLSMGLWTFLLSTWSLM